jgi:hypothetical protein
MNCNCTGPAGDCPCLRKARERLPVAHFPPFDDVDKKPEKTSTFSDSFQVKMVRKW